MHNTICVDEYEPYLVKRKQKQSICKTNFDANIVLYSTNPHGILCVFSFIFYTF